MTHVTENPQSPEPLAAKRTWGRWLLRRLYGLLFLLLFFGGGYLILSRNERYAVYVSFFEKTPPEMELLSTPAGIGIDGTTLKLRVEDRGTGLDEVIIRIDQQGEVQELLKKRYDEPRFSDTFELKIVGKDRGLTEGPLDLQILVFDRAFWSNGLKREIPLQVSFARPKVEVVSPQHNAVLGGSELCFYRVTNLEDGVSGVRVGDVEFRGYPARLLDTAFEVDPALHFSYFAIPLQFRRERDEVRVFARNSVGNETTTPFYYKALPVRSVRRSREVGALFVEGKLVELAERFQSFDSSSSVPGAPKERFDAVFSGLRKLNERKLRKLLKNEETHSAWEGGFARPSGAQLRVDFGDVRDYYLESELLGSVLYTGAEHATSGEIPVMAAAPGKVVFRGELPLYGKSVVVDHGFGLATVYGFLSSLGAINDGDSVDHQTVLGRSGMSGFLDSPGLLYEVRVHGIPVRPVEWWDARWVRDHIRQKIDETKKQLNLVPTDEVSGPTEEE